MIGIEWDTLVTMLGALGALVMMLLAALWAGVRPELEKWFTEQGKTLWKRFRWWSKAEAEYRKKMRLQHDTVRVLGKKSEPMPLEGLFTDVYILDKLTAFHPDSELLKGKKRQHGLDVVKNHNRLFIWGKPGAGKTTFLKYLTLQAIKGNIQKIPLFVSLRKWADSQLELIPFLVEQFEICNFPDAKTFIEHILRRGDALVLFDGLDEVQQDGEQRTKIINMLCGFRDKYSSSQCVITCRIAATDYSFEQFTYVEVADFTYEQMQTFVNNWFRQTPKVAENFLTEFVKENHHGLRDLGRIPLLLSLLCLNYEATQTFPARRVEIYDEAINALLKDWDSSQKIKRDEGYRKLSLEHKRQLFAKVGYDTFIQNEYLIPQKELVSKIVEFLRQLPGVDTEDNQDNGEEVLKAIEARHGIFTECARRTYSFSHLTFQEYFTAKYIVETPERVQTLVTTHFDDYRWWEVFLLVASSLGDADHFFECFKQAIDNLVKQDQELVALLQWADKKANAVETSHKIGAVRSFYLFLALAALTFALTLTDFISPLIRTRIDHRRTLADFALTLDAALDLDLLYLDPLDLLGDLLDLDSALDLLKRDLDLSLKIDFLLLIALMISLVFIETIATEENMEKNMKNIPKFKKYFHEVVEQSCSFPSLHEALLHLPSVPDSPSEPELWEKWEKFANEWEKFANELRTVMQRERNIGHEWNLTDKQVEMMNSYLSANWLMVECLKLVAVSDGKVAVSDRKAIEDSVLLPPVV